jgi:hypothetical protein
VRAEEIMNDRGRVDLAPLNGAQDAGQGFLGVRAVVGPVPATDFAGNHGESQSLFYTPVEWRAYCYAELSSRRSPDFQSCLEFCPFL